ncbi:MAG TPA: hypothetical protein VJV05_01890, partial [Pyrinomonadaceae bacterium]|nr:hypothetical protein [Pyrinomonadaceae bacterium]
IYGEVASGVKVSISVFKKFHAIKNRQSPIVPFLADVAQPANGGGVITRMLTSGEGVDVLSGTLVHTVPTRVTKAPIFTDFDKLLLDRFTADEKAEQAADPNHKRIHKGRARLTPLNQINWDKATVYQAATIAHGHLLHFKQQWLPDGYSIGDLLYSLPLAPGQKKQIAVLDWERRESAANSQSLDYEESLNNSLVRDRDISEVVSATLDENLSGTSTAKTGSIAGGFGAGALGMISGVAFGSVLGISGGTSKATSTASQTSHRDSTASSLQSIRDRTQQAASAVRSQRSTVIQTVSQGERVQATSESIANYNHCHAITIQYFEVVRHFAIQNRFVGAQECLFIPLQISNFDIEKALRWRNTLERRLRIPKLRSAFAALERIQNERESAAENYYDSIGFPRNRYAEQQILNFQGELFIEFYFFNTKDTIDDALILFFKRFFKLDLNEYKDRKLTDAELSRIVGPRTIELLMDAMVIETQGGQSLNLDVTLLTPFRQNARLQVSLRQETPVSIAREAITGVRIRLDENKVKADDATDIKQFSDKYMKILVRSGNLRYNTSSYSESLFNTRIDNDLFVGVDSVFIPTPLNGFELRNPRGEDVDAANNLIHHLNENLEYYHKCLWFDMTPERRYMLLDGIVAPGKANGRSVASVVENRIVGVAGNSLIMPVAPGFQLDPSIDDSIDLFARYYNEDSDPGRVSLPTKGVYAEAVIGKCNSCEEKDEGRFWRWEESPIPDSPNTQINPLNTDTRRSDPGNLEAKDFPTPIVNVQNAPAAPDPTGLQTMLALIGKGDSFRDVTGLSENQKNAIAAFQSSLQSAQAFGKEAADLAKTAAMIDVIKDAQKSGTITKDEAKDKAGKAIDSGIPPSPEQKLAQVKEQVALINDLQQRGLLPAKDAQNAINKIVGGLTGDANGKILERNNFSDIVDKVDNSSITGLNAKKTPDGQEELSITKENQAPGVAPASNIVATPQDRTFNPPFGLGITQLRPAAGLITATNQFHWLLDEGAVRTGTSNVSIGRARVDPATGNVNLTPADFSNDSSVHVLARKPGIFTAALFVRDTTSGNIRSAGSTEIGIPQFVEITEPTAAYTVDAAQPHYAGITDPHLFSTVLNRVFLANRREEVLRKTRAVCENLLRTVNVRMIWNVQLPDTTFMDDKAFMLSFQTDNIPNFERDFVSKVQLKGYPPSFGVYGVTSNTSIHVHNEITEMFPGMMDLPRNPIFNSPNSQVEFRIQQILRELDRLNGLLTANPNDQPTQNEFNRVLNLWVEVFSRMLGHSMSHEICHSLLGQSGGLTSDGHSPANSPNLLSRFPANLPDATGIQITDPGTFPAAGSFSVGLFTNLRQFVANIDNNLKRQLDVLYAVPPTPPFDR